MSLAWLNISLYPSQVANGQVVSRVRMAFVGGLAKPSHGLVLVLVHAVAVQQLFTHQVHGVGVTQAGIDVTQVKVEHGKVEQAHVQQEQTHYHPQGQGQDEVGAFGLVKPDKDDTIIIIS